MSQLEHTPPLARSPDRQHTVDQIPSRVQPALLATTERQPWELYALIGLVIAQSSLIMLNTPMLVAVWLLGILALTVGQALLVPGVAAWCGSLLGLVLWVLFQKTTGGWRTETILQNLAELLGLALNAMLALRYRWFWHKQQKELQELRALRHLLIAHEQDSGLLSRPVAELRLHEEIERARHFQRPVGLLLLNIEPHDSLSPELLQDAYKAIVRQLICFARLHDLPFRASAKQLGLIILERDLRCLYREIDELREALQETVFLGHTGQLHSVTHAVCITFGLGMYQGEQGCIDLIRAAQDSLQISLDIPLEYGSASVVYAMPAVSIQLIESDASAMEE